MSTTLFEPCYWTLERTCRTHSDADFPSGDEYCVSASLVRTLISELSALHKPFLLCEYLTAEQENCPNGDPSDHLHYYVCAECCTDSGNQTAHCKEKHGHHQDGTPLCHTMQLLEESLGR